jgi:hypothetical protein
MRCGASTPAVLSLSPPALGVDEVCGTAGESSADALANKFAQEALGQQEQLGLSPIGGLWDYLSQGLSCFLRAAAGKSRTDLTILHCDRPPGFVCRAPGPRLWTGCRTVPAFAQSSHLHSRLPRLSAIVRERDDRQQ